jgi:ribosomal protein S18 acetylase RimI-like enzyme
MSLRIRYANEDDTPVILEFIKELAEFENMGGQVAATQEDIRRTIFDKHQAEVLLGENNGTPVAFLLFYPVYSTFLGKANLFLEDLFVKEEYRGRGCGREMLRRLAQIAVEYGAERLDWYVLDDNAQGAAFYKHLGADALLDRRTYRLDGNKLIQLAKQEATITICRK